MLYFYNTFAIVFRRLGYENDVFGHAWTLLGHCLDAFRMAFSLPKDVCLNTRISSCLTIASFFPAVFCQACNFLRCRYLPTMAELCLSAPEGKLCAREQAKAWALRALPFLHSLFPSFLLSSLPFLLPSFPPLGLSCSLIGFLSLSLS